MLFTLYAYRSDETTEPAGQVEHEVAPPGLTPVRVIEVIFAMVFSCSWLEYKGILFTTTNKNSVNNWQNAGDMIVTKFAPPSKVNRDIVITCWRNGNIKLINLVGITIRESHILDYVINPQSDRAIISWTFHRCNKSKLDKKKSKKKK